MTKTNASALQLDEIQGLLASGYGRQRAMCALLLQIPKAAAARTWLKKLVPQLTFCNDKSGETKLNLAWTYPGLQQLLDPRRWQGLSREFCEGMVRPHRQRALGDLPASASDPEQWQWGGPNNPAVHAVLLAYAENTAALESLLKQQRRRLRGLQVLDELRSTPLQDQKEHFGFRDGMGQPWVEQLTRPGSGRDQVAAGELVLGYADNTGVAEPAPELAANGSYLVFRQIAQRVPEFWRAFPDLDDEQKIWRAAKMVGRWPDGTPLTLSPEAPDPKLPQNDFGFSDQDGDGARCPFGAHIRRANPRDALLDDPRQAQQAVNRHRLLRRGRAFGLPAPPEAYPGDLQVTADDDAVGDEDQRGLFFICLNASLSRQFEFCQQSWLNNPKFHELTAETDAIASPVQWAPPDARPVLTEQAQPLRLRVVEREKFVHTIGGGYFLLPSRSALLEMASKP